MKKISHMDIVEENGSFSEAIITYEDGTNQVIKGASAVAMALIEFVKQTGINYEGLLNDATKVTVQGHRRRRRMDSRNNPETNPNPVVRTNPEVNPDPVVRTNPETNPDPVVRTSPEVNPDPSFKRNKKVIGAALGVGVIGVIAALCIPNIGKKSNQILSNKDSYDLKNKSPYISMKSNDNSKENDNSVYVDGDSKYVVEPTSFTTINYAPMTNTDFCEKMNDINWDLNLNITDIANFLNTGGINRSNPEYLLELETFFYQGTIEYEIMRYVSDLRNSLVHNAYNIGSINDTKYWTKKFYDFYSEFVFKGSAFGENNNIEFRFLNSQAQYMIVLLGQYYLNIPVDYSMNYSGKIWNKQILKQESESLFSSICERLGKRSTK